MHFRQAEAEAARDSKEITQVSILVRRKEYRTIVFHGKFYQGSANKLAVFPMNHRACLSCRARKVRCDVAFSRDSCTNCVLDSKKCVVHWRRRHDYRYEQLVEFRYGSFVSCVPLPN